MTTYLHTACRFGHHTECRANRRAWLAYARELRRNGHPNPDENVEARCQCLCHSNANKGEYYVSPALDRLDDLFASVDLKEKMT